MSFRHLSDDRLDAVRQAAMGLGLNTDANLDALAAGVNRAFIGGAMTGGNANAKLVTVTARMNETRALVSGEVPLATWLGNAILLAGGDERELVFRAALEEMASDSAPATAAAPDVDDAPRTGDGAGGGALEIEIDEDDTLGVLFLERGAAAARSVAKLRVHRHFGGVASMRPGGTPDWGLGTGWLLGPDLLVTNFHVVAARGPTEGDAAPADFDLQAAATQIDFDFYADDTALTTVTAQACVASDRTLDYALLRVDVDRPPLRLRTAPLLRPPTSALRERVNVLQHPNGTAMRLGFRNNFVVTGVAERLSYLTDTAGGSSGSPIFDDAWEVAGLHRGWATIKGPPVQVWGKEIRQENYGTPIGALLADVAAKDAAVHAEILAGQA